MKLEDIVMKTLVTLLILLVSISAMADIPMDNIRDGTTYVTNSIYCSLKVQKEGLKLALTFIKNASRKNSECYWDGRTHYV